MKSRIYYLKETESGGERQVVLELWECIDRQFIYEKRKKDKRNFPLMWNLKKKAQLFNLVSHYVLNYTYIYICDVVILNSGDYNILNKFIISLIYFNIMVNMQQFIIRVE